MSKLNRLEEPKILENDEEQFKQYCGNLRKTRSLNNKMLLVKVPQMDMDIFEPKIARNKGYQVYPPVGLQYLAQALDGSGLEIKILDMNYEILRRTNFEQSFNYRDWMSTLTEQLKEHNPSIVGVSSMFEALEYPNFKKVLNYLGEEGSRIILIGGTSATYEVKGDEQDKDFRCPILEERLCDAVFQRESENKIKHFINTLQGKNNSTQVPGIYFMLNGKLSRSGKGNDLIAHASIGNLIKQHANFPVGDYYKVGTLGPMSRMAGVEKPFATPLVTRGCRFSCSFCDVRNLNGKGTRNREVKDVLDEMKYLYDSQGIRHFEFLDDDLGGGDKQYIIELFGGIKQKFGSDISWSAQNGMIAKYLDEDILKSFDNTNCVGFKVGVETGDPEMLHYVEKPGTIESFREFAQRMKSHPKLIVPQNYIIGFRNHKNKKDGVPDENFMRMMRTYWFSGEVQMDWSAYSVYQPIGNRKTREDEKADINFIPVKSKRKMELAESDGILSGADIFCLPLEQIPSHKQMGQIWNTFNLARNFVHNVNLKPQGNPGKFIRYVEALQENYCLNPYMPLFLALAHTNLGNNAEKEKYIIRMQENLAEGVGIETFDKFGLTKYAMDFPNTPSQAREVLNSMQKEHSWYENPETFIQERERKGFRLAADQIDYISKYIRERKNKNI